MDKKEKKTIYDIFGSVFMCQQELGTMKTDTK